MGECKGFCPIEPTPSRWYGVAGHLVLSVLLKYLNETKVSKAIAEDIKSTPILKYPKLVSCMKPYIKTNMDTASLIKYGIITYKIVSHKS